MNLNDKVIAITGAGGIICSEFAKELANNEEIKSLYKFDFDKANVKYFLEKEHASNAREPFISEIRDQNIGFLVGFLGVLLIVLIAMSAFRTPAVSLMPDVTPKPLRSKGNAIINLFSPLIVLGNINVSPLNICILPFPNSRDILCSNSWAFANSKSSSCKIILKN